MSLTALAETSQGGITAVAAVSSIGLALVHLVSGRWQFSGPNVRRRFLSLAGGASVAYVFVLLLPEVSEQSSLAAGETAAAALLAEQRVYVAALSGFVVFYGLEVFVTQHRDEEVEASELVFWVHIAIFACYSGLIGYVLFHREGAGLLELLYYAVAMALHFTVTDYGLRHHHQEAFYRLGRWILAGTTLLGGLIGFGTEIEPVPLSMLFGFLAGSIVLNIIKEELPGLDQSRFGAFVVGATVYTVLLLLT